MNLRRPDRAPRACRLLLASLAAAALLAAAPATAGSFQVNPVRVDLRAGATTAAIVVRNDGAEPIVVQTSVLAWSQDGGRDVYTATQDALATPPIATIAPGAEQIVRVGLRRAPDAERELSYRLYVQEIPPPPAAGFGGLQVALRVGVPVFVAPLAAPKREVAWSAQPMPDGTLKLTATQRGNVHLQLAGFTLAAPGGGDPVASEIAISYVLAGQSREWSLKVPAARLAQLPAVRLTAQTDAGDVDAAIPLPR